MYVFFHISPQFESNMYWDVVRSLVLYVAICGLLFVCRSVSFCHWLICFCLICCFWSTSWQKCRIITPNEKREREGGGGFITQHRKREQSIGFMCYGKVSIFCYHMWYPSCCKYKLIRSKTRWNLFLLTLNLSDKIPQLRIFMNVTHSWIDRIQVR